MSDYVPLFQTLAWIFLIAALLFYFRSQTQGLLSVVQERIRRGSGVKLGARGFELAADPDLRTLEPVRPAPTRNEEMNLEILGPARTRPEAAMERTSQEGFDSSKEDWLASRDRLYRETRGVFLAHVLEPSRVANQRYDILIFLVGHASRDFNDVERAEFFLGPHWGSGVFEVENTGKGAIGITTSAFGTFLCVCRVTFTDGGSVLLHRYIDFEMARLFQG